jgi:site-specific recombinase XerC
VPGALYHQSGPRRARAQACGQARQNPDAVEEQARQLLDSIDISTVVGLRDRALIGVMTFALARVGAVVAMRVEDYYPQGKRWWVRLHEKGGKRHEMPAHHTLEAYLDAYIDAARRMSSSDPERTLAAGGSDGSPCPKAVIETPDPETE